MRLATQALGGSSEKLAFMPRVFTVELHIRRE